jgi:exopolyphosphatase / guanosine-5'-triphosphate,3'-diphosphate pyrophosphatase
LNLGKSKDGQSISAAKIKRIRSRLAAYTVAERITRLGLKPDRADVILPAIRIYLSVLNWAKIPSIKVPQMGLADGIIRRLYEQHDSGAYRRARFEQKERQNPGQQDNKDQPRK